MARVDHAVSAGTFSLDGETFDVDNNIWVVGDDSECIVIDAPHSVDDILAVVGDRKVKAIVCTHAHDDHVRVAPELRERVVAPIMLHPDDRPLWELTHTDHLWDLDLADGVRIEVGGTTLEVLHTPGHAPGAVCLYAPDLGCVFTGDTLFQGGPGATGRSFSDAGQIKESIRARLFALPDDKPVWELTHTDHLWDLDLADRLRIEVGGTTLEVLHTPGHAPGAVCLYAPGLGCVFTGDTLFQGGPGATGRSFSDRPTIEASIRARLFALPDETVVHTGHGDDTTIGAEKASLT